MNSGKKIFVSAFCAVSLGAAAACLAFGGRTALIRADECSHDKVEHYVGGNGHVDHYACCQCHTAWADAARTVVLSTDTATDRTKIDFTDKIGFQVNWDASYSVPFYDSVRGHSYHENLQDLTSGAYNVIETVNSAFQLDSATSLGYYGRLTNHTSGTLNVTVFTRNWNNIVLSQTAVAAGATLDFNVSVSQWNAEATSSGNYGFAIYCVNTVDQTAGDYIEITSPEMESNLASFVGDIQDVNWHSYTLGFDDKYGVVYRKDVTGNSAGTIFLRDRVTIDDTAYGGVSFRVYNGGTVDSTSGNIWNEDWANHTTHGVMKAGEWTSVYVPASVWNGGNSQISIYDMGEVNGVFKVGGFELVRKAAFGTAANEVITIQDSNWASATKTSDDEKGNIFNIAYPGSGALATNNASNVDAATVKEVEFYVYNGTGSDMSMYSTTDWAVNTVYGTIPSGVWTRCAITAAEWNKASITYFYPTASAGTILFTYFYAVSL